MLHSLPDGTALRCLLDTLNGVHARATSALALACSNDGKLDPDLCDQRQVPAFELAWCRAELFAIERAVAAYDAAASEIDVRLSAIFVAETVTLIRDRLEGICLNLELDEDTLSTVYRDNPCKLLRRSALADRFLCDTSQLLSHAPEQIARIELSGELAMVQDVFSRFARETVAPLAERIHRENLTIPEPELLQPLREMGVFGLSIPQSYGGSALGEGNDSLTMVVATEALSEGSLAAAGSLITRPEILSRALLAGATEAQKQHWLPRLASGESLCAIAITEPDYGSDVAGLSMRGTPCEGGWLLNGSKTWCTFAGKADVLMVVTRTDVDKSKGHRGLSLLLAEKPSFDGHSFDYTQPGGGRIAGTAIDTIGYRGMHSFDVVFEDYFVAEAHVIGETEGLGQGFYYTMAGMMGGRVQTAARASGVMRAALLAALRYAEERKVFGAPLIEYSLTASRLSRMAARYAASRHLAYDIAQLLDTGGGRLEASLVKLFACRSAEIVTREALQIHGGMGYAEEMPVSRYFVDARVLSIFEGAEETLALKVIAKSLMEAALAEQAASTCC